MQKACRGRSIVGERLKQLSRPPAMLLPHPLVLRLRKQIASHIGIFRHDPGDTLHIGDVGVDALIHHLDQL